jgi:transposase
MYRLREGCSWRALSIFAPYSTIYGWWRYWSESGIWDDAFSKVSTDASGQLWAIDSTCCKVHKHGLCWSQTLENQCIGRTRGGANTKIHALVDADGKPVDFLLSPGNANDILFAEDLVEGQTHRVILADKAYDSDAFRAFLETNSLQACIPPRANRIDPIDYDQEDYKKRHQVENCFQRLKEYRAIATRYEKLDLRFLSMVTLAAILAWF